MEQEIGTKIQAALAPVEVSVTCNDPQSGKYSVRVVSDAFKGKSLLQRHRAVNSAVGMSDPTVQAAIHALEIDAKTPEECAP